MTNACLLLHWLKDEKASAIQFYLIVVIFCGLVGPDGISGFVHACFMHWHLEVAPLSLLLLVKQAENSRETPSVKYSTHDSRVGQANLIK